jgi:hypothetical protein
MKAFLGVLVAVFLFAACSNALQNAGSSGPTFSSDSHINHGASNDPPQSPSDCENAVSHSNQALKDLNAGDYSGGYKNASTAVRLSESCDNTDMPSVKGFALSFKAFNEHHLSVGDSETDMNQAEQLLSDCQSQPGYYGTHAGALCDTQEENDIQTKTDWEMANY